MAAVPADEKAGPVKVSLFSLQAIVKVLNALPNLVQQTSGLQSRGGDFGRTNIPVYLSSIVAQLHVSKQFFKVWRAVLFRRWPCYSAVLRDISKLAFMDRDATELVTWREAAADLQIELEAPFVVTAFGKSYTYFARLPQFGSELGMLLMLDYYPELSEVADANGYGFSCVEVGATYDREGFIEILCDWGWAAEAKPPSWYKGWQ